MKTSELSVNGIYAYKERPSLSWSYPVKLLEIVLWTERYEWGNWDNAEKRTEAIVVKRAPKRSRAGETGGYGYSRRVTGLPVLKIERDDLGFTGRVQGKILTSVEEIFAKAEDQMHVTDVVKEGHDGRFVGEIRNHAQVTIDLSDGTQEEISVVLVLARPQQILDHWGSHLEKVIEAAKQRRQYEAEKAKRLADNNATAKDIVSRVHALTGYTRQEGGRYGMGYPTGENYELHRRHTATGLSTTYEISEKLLLELIEAAEAAEKNAGQ